MENKPKLRKKTISLTERHSEMIDLIQKQIGLSTSSAVLYRGLEELYGKLFPSYKYGGTSPTKTDENTHIAVAINKQKGKEAAKKVQEEAKWAPKIDMCVNMLHGSVEQRGSGRVCVFKMHTPMDSVEQVIPLIQVDPIVAETSLFSPDKETVLASREDLRKQFSK